MSNAKSHESILIGKYERRSVETGSEILKAGPEGGNEERIGRANCRPMVILLMCMSSLCHQLFILEE